ncbi:MULTISPECIES: SDR family oxidoreductase [Methanobacterium]|uniref:GDP-mannose 4,6-dehydratase n=1 Tax=Methanobacterium bryantii TaxID=2161 RepID=A0A2A2HAL5_METBR|nr:MULTISPECIES: SDR family oxidoreductase [Methanobacterium]OEC88449.1 GDP-mannose 4,6-dehydratase [Methanobacterium sp. A39]PAV06395.1 GDP-mannose 4,6-dehydratase [Methanobacterium bryantii]
MKNKKVVVTGGLGFIGSHLVEKLSQDNLVVIIDDQSTGNIENIKHFNISKIDTTLGDITSINLEEIFDGADYVFHEAAVTSVQKSVDDPFISNKVNITGTLKVLEAAKNTDVKKVVLASSSAVYGDTESLPLSEDDPVNPLSPYAVGKTTGELYCNVFSEIYGLPTISLRYFNVFGPRQDPNSQYAAVIPIFIDKILKNESPIIYGDGEQSRDFVSVKNIVAANIMAAESKLTGAFNIGLGKSTTINQLFLMIKEIIGIDIQPIYEKERPGDIKYSLADISKAKSMGYDPKADFKEELKETVEWFKKVLS